MVTIHSLKQDKCVWCAKLREGVQVSFSDGSLSGFICWSDFRKLLKSRAREGDQSATRVDLSPKATST